MRIGCYETMEKPVAGSLCLKCLNVHGKCFSFKARIQKFSKLVEMSCSQEMKSKWTIIYLNAWHASLKHVSCVYIVEVSFIKKYFLVWLLFFIDLCSQKKAGKGTELQFMYTRHPPRCKSRRPWTDVYQALALTAIVYSSNTLHNIKLIT